MAHVLVMGASRGIGLETVRQALAAGHRVRAMARSADAVAIADPRLEPFAGDALDPARVGQAVAGVDAVIQALGIGGGAAMLRPVTLFSQATQILVAAMRQAEVRRLVCLTGFGAGNSRDRGGLVYNAAFKLFLGRAYADKDVQEAIVRDSGLDWVIVRPVILSNGPRTGRYRVLTDPRRWRCGIISRADVADFLVKQIDDDRYLRQTPVLTD